jgi:hypothetical protein
MRGKKLVRSDKFVTWMGLLTAVLPAAAGRTRLGLARTKWEQGFLKTPKITQKCFKIAQNDPKMPQNYSKIIKNRVKLPYPFYHTPVLCAP